MRPIVRLWVFLGICGLAMPSLGLGIDSVGNADGALTWRLGALEPGESVREVVLFADGDTYESVSDGLRKARSAWAKTIGKASPTQDSRTEESPKSAVWIANDATDFALEEAGYFLWEGNRQTLTCPAGGQLSRFGYYVHYERGTVKHAGTSITEKGKLRNLKVVQPIRALGENELGGTVETADGALRIVIHAAMGAGSVAGAEFVFTNIGSKPLGNVDFSVYANIESNHTHADDYGVLDRTTGSLIAYDLQTHRCAAMAGISRPAFGYAGVWASASQMENGTGVEFENWGTFRGMDSDAEKEILDRLAQGALPHPPAVALTEPTEPETRTLTAAEAEEVLREDWLFQAEEHALVDRARQEIGWARELADRLAKSPQAPKLDGELADLRRLEERLQKLAARADEGPDAEKLYLAVRQVKRRILFKNPAIDFSQVLLIDNPYPQGAEWPHQARHRNGMMSVPGGRLLVLDGLHPGGTVRKLAPGKPGGFWRPDLSFDAQRVVFCYWPYDEKSYHLYEINLDGTGLRQLTDGDYDDIDPIYLPDGKIMFSTTRGNTYVRCMPYTYSYVLARCDPDGENVYLVSQNNEPDWLPTLLNDGRVIYSRWEYTDKALWRIQSLWTTNPDGTNTSVFWGNQSVWPDHLTEARPIPGSPRVMFTGVAHHNWFDGSIGILDPREGFNFPDGLTKVTADVAWPECGEPPVDPVESPRYHSEGAYTAYKTPYPISEEDFLVSARGSDGNFRLYLMDVDGNRELIYEGAYNVWHAMPVKPRPHLPSQADRVAWPGTGEARKSPDPGMLYSTDIYQNVPDLPRGSVKYMRVLQIDAKTSSSWLRDSRFSGPGTSVLQDDGVKRILGTVPVAEDGSVYFKAPAGRSLHFQVLDEHYRALQTMRTFAGVMPGETRGCVGCHELHSVAPVNRTGIALQQPPQELDPPPWGADVSISYEGLVQPVLDRHCGKCHQEDGKAKETLDLTLRPGDQWFFKEPYLTLVGQAWPVGSGFDTPSIAGALLIENFEMNDPSSYTTFRPGRGLSYTSKLIDIAMSGKHHDVKVDPVGLRTLIGWVDANCPYRGEEDLRAIPDPTFSGVDLLPVRPRVKTAPIVHRP